MEPFARSLHFKLHHGAEGRRVAVRGHVVFGHSEAPQIFERQIDSAFRIVNGYVLPEVRQLQGRAGAVRQFLPLGIAIAAQIEHEMAHGIRRVSAVAEQRRRMFDSAW